MSQAAIQQTEQKLHALYTALIFSRPGNNSEYSQADQDYWVVKNYSDPQKLEFAIAPIERELKVTVEQEADDWLDRRIKIDHPGLRRRMKRYQEVHAERWEEALAVGAEQLAKRREKAIAKLQDLKQQVEANSANLMRWVEELEKMVAELRSLDQPAVYEDRYLDAIQTIRGRIETYQNLYLPKIAELIPTEDNASEAIAPTETLEDNAEVREAVPTGEAALQTRLHELYEERTLLWKTEGRLLRNNRHDLLTGTGEQLVALNDEIQAIRRELYPENYVEVEEPVPEPEEPPFKPGDWVEAEAMRIVHGKTASIIVRGTVVEPHPGVDDDLPSIPIEYMLYEPDYPNGIKARVAVPLGRIKKLDEPAPICDITRYLPPKAEPAAVNLEELEEVKDSDRPQGNLPVFPTEELDASLAGKPVRFELYTAIWNGTATGYQTKTHIEVQYSPSHNKPDAKVKIPRTDLIELDGQYVDHPDYQEGDRVRILDVGGHQHELIGQTATVLKVSPKVVRLQFDNGATYTFYRHVIEPAEQIDEDTPGDINAALLAAVRQQGGLSQWDTLKGRGATDQEIKQLLGRAFGDGCGSSVPHSWSAKGGGSPRFWNQITSQGKPDLQGQDLVQRVRELLQIPSLESPTPETFETPTQAIASLKPVRHIGLLKQPPRLCGVFEGVYYLASHLTPWQAEAMTSLCPNCYGVWRSQLDRPLNAHQSEAPDSDTQDQIELNNIQISERSRPVNPEDPIVKVWRRSGDVWYYAGQMGYQSKVTLRPGDITCLPEIDPNIELAVSSCQEEPEAPAHVVTEVIAELAIASSQKASSGKQESTGDDAIAVGQLSLF